MRAFVLVVALALVGCPSPKDSLVFVLPDGSAAKDAAFDFGPRGASVKRTVLLENQSGAELAIGDAVLEGSAFLAGIPAQVLSKDARLPVVVEYQPAGDDVGALRVVSPSGTALASLSLAGTLDAAKCALPDFVDFGAVLVGESVQRSVDFPVLEVRREVFVDAPGAPYQLPFAAPAGSQSVGAGVQLTARAVLPAQTTPGEFDATWKLDPGGDCVPRDVPLRATVLTTFLTASPSTVDFGVVTPPGQPAAAATLFNALSRPVSVTLEVQSSSGGPTTNFRTALTQLVLPPATRDAMGGWKLGEAEVPMSAVLLGPGTVQGSLLVHGPGVELTVPLVARGSGAGLVVTPSPVELQVPLVGSRLVPVATGVSVVNDDTSLNAASVAVSQVTVEAAPGTQVSELCAGQFDEAQARCTASPAFTVAPGSQHSLGLRITPSGTGPWRWFVVLHTDDVNAPELRFEVRAQSRTLGDCVLGHAPTLTFGLVRAPTPLVVPLVLENQGQATCVVQGAWVEGSGDVRAASGITLAPGEQRLFDVEYLPSEAPGTAGSPTLRFSVNSVMNPVHAVPMSTFSDDGCLFVTPEQFDLGVVAPSCGARVQTIGMGNRCATDEVAVTAVRVSGSGAFSIVGTPPERIAANSFVPSAFQVAFDPTAAGVSVGSLDFSVVVTGGTRRLSVPMRGNADVVGRQRDRFVMPSSADAVLVQSTEASMSAMWTGVAASSQSLLDASRNRARSIRWGVLDAQVGSPTALRPVSAQRWLEVDVSSASSIASLLTVPAAATSPHAYLAPPWAALSGAGITGVNKGFLRRGASLNVAVASDSGDHSTFSASVVLPQVAAIKGSHRPELLSWSHLGPRAAVAPSGCSYGALGNADVDASPARAFGGVIAEVCDVKANPSLFASQVAPMLFGDRDRLRLRAPIQPGALPVVTVGGVGVPEMSAGGGRNWSFDVTERAVIFSGLTLRGGEVVEFDYPTLCP